MGMYIGQSTKIVNRKNGEITYGKIPPYSVVVPGCLPDKNNPSAPSLSCAVIIKQVDEVIDNGKLNGKSSTLIINNKEIKRWDLL